MTRVITQEQQMELQFLVETTYEEFKAEYLNSFTLEAVPTVEVNFENGMPVMSWLNLDVEVDLVNKDKIKRAYPQVIMFEIHEMFELYDQLGIHRLLDHVEEQVFFKELIRMNIIYALVKADDIATEGNSFRGSYVEDLPKLTKVRTEFESTGVFYTRTKAFIDLFFPTNFVLKHISDLAWMISSFNMDVDSEKQKFHVRLSQKVWTIVDFIRREYGGNNTPMDIQNHKPMYRVKDPNALVLKELDNNSYLVFFNRQAEPESGTRITLEDVRRYESNGRVIEYMNESE
jgi:hypothetical protein